MDLALGRAKECPFPTEAVRELKDEIAKVLSSRGLQLRRGTRMPGHPALYRPKRKWRLESQKDPTNWQQEEEKQSGFLWMQNYADKVEAVFDDQTSTGQVLKFTKAEARARFPDLVVPRWEPSAKTSPTA